MRNERFAVRQKLAEIYRAQLSSTQARLDAQWKSRLAGIEKLARTAPPSAAFFKCVQTGWIGSVILREQQRVLYPNSSAPLQEKLGELDPNWAEASRLEYLRKDFIGAAKLYDGLATAATNVNMSARALQAQARCLLQAGNKDDAIRLITEVLDRYPFACDPQGRLIIANAELMVLELIPDRHSPRFQFTAERLKRRLMDYENPGLGSSQRRFLMKELQSLSPETIQFPTLAAEELAAEYLDQHPDFTRDSGLLPARAPGLWQAATDHHQALLLFRAENLGDIMKAIATPDDLLPGAKTSLLPPGGDYDAAFVSLPAGPAFPGWRLALSLNDGNIFDTAARHRTAVYFWAGILVIAAMSLLALLAVRLVRRQVALARLKNDLAATVSHELKTPLSSMRVLVDTLLDSKQLTEPAVREYLQLIAGENERLSRLIESFLTFSRMERKKYAFNFTRISARHLIEAVLEAARDRFAAPGCRFDMQVQGDLPDIIADQDALVTALINLLENAYKYSDEIKQITLRVGAEGGNLIVSVQDHGIGIAPREIRRIFNHFYQVDQRLSRKGGGCGLGLSIVQFIVHAHDGAVRVESELGRGATFTISLPICAPASLLATEAIA
jgi:signal transduction histidine kinase